MITKTSDSQINIPIFHKNSCALNSKSGSFFCKRKYKGALYVYILIIVLLATTLSLITGLVFDGNLKNAVTQRDHLQLYYYSRAGADWAINLIQSKEPELSISSGSKISLADKLRADTTYHVKWTGQGDLKAKGNEVGRFSVTIEKVKKRVDSAGQFVATGGREVDYAKITSVGKSLSKDSTGGTLVEGEQEHVITVLVSLDALDNVIYMPGER
ncbi:hypothetical protein [Filifactor alocis]